MEKENRGVTRDREIEGDDVYPLLHTDGTQAICYFGLSIPKLGVDMFSCNSSKIYGPKGVGLLIKNNYVEILPVMANGSQEFGLRSGTEPVALIAGFAEAFKIAQESAVSETFRLLPLREKLISGLNKISEKHNLKLYLNGALDNDRIVNNVNVSFEDTNHEYLVILLDNDGFAVSTKSACNERDAEESHVLYALKEAADNKPGQPLSALRITMGTSTNDENIDLLLNAIDNNLRLSRLTFGTK